MVSSASLPERDRLGQLARMADELEHITGRRPRGAWLAERVWEPDLPTSLARAGYGWTILDDNHFRAAAIREERLWGPYTTDDQGHLLTVFGTEKGLRYRIPFGEVDDLIAYLRDEMGWPIARDSNGFEMSLGCPSFSCRTARVSAASRSA